jgi:hypothetical protein
VVATGAVEATTGAGAVEAGVVAGVVGGGVVGGVVSWQVQVGDGFGFGWWCRWHGHWVPEDDGLAEVEAEADELGEPVVEAPATPAKTTVDPAARKETLSAAPAMAIRDRSNTCRFFI